MCGSVIPTHQNHVNAPAWVPHSAVFSPAIRSEPLVAGWLAESSSDGSVVVLKGEIESAHRRAVPPINGAGAGSRQGSGSDIAQDESSSNARENPQGYRSPKEAVAPG